MSSPSPPDPYAVLGVKSDADLATIRSAHRKLVLKFHPDRIRDEAEREKGKAEFQRVQQAYELLSDTTKRARHDNNVKLAELQKERMSREPPRESARSSAYTSKTTHGGSTPRRREASDGVYYEDRAPPDNYFENRDRFDEPIPRATARKYDSYDTKPASSSKFAERRDKIPSKREKVDKPVEGISQRMADLLKAAAQRQKDNRARDNAQDAKIRDQEKRRERSDKHSSRRSPYVEADYSASDSDTAVPRYAVHPRAAAGRPRAHTEAEVRSRAFPPRRTAYEHDEDSYTDEEKSERHHRNARDYIAESQQRPSLSRTGSNAHHYWERDHSSNRRSGSDSDRRPSSSRRTAADDARARPAMPVHTSAPSNLRASAVDREPVRSKTSSYPNDREQRRDPPGLNRSQTMPVSRSMKKDPSAPIRGSNLKHGETQPDSGYYSSSSPHTPEMRGESPPRNVPREGSRKQQSTKYQIVDPDSDQELNRNPRVTRIIESDDDDRSRRYRSPESQDRRDRDRDQPRERADRPRLSKLDTDVRPKTSRAPDSRTSMPRNEYARYESQSPRGSPSVHRNKLFAEIDVEDRDPAYSYQYDPSNLKTSSHRPGHAVYSNSYRGHNVEDGFPSSRFKEGLHGTSRRPSAGYA